MNDKNQIGTTSFQAVLGTVISSERKKMNISQSELANKLGVTASTLSRIENGESAMTIDQLHVVSEALGMKPHELLAATEGVEKLLKKTGIDAVGERSKLVSSNDKDDSHKTILKGASLLPFALPFLGGPIGLAIAAGIGIATAANKIKSDAQNGEYGEIDDSNKD